MFLYHTKVRWLSSGRVLSRLFEFQDEIQQFLCKAGHELAGYFDEPKSIQAPAYLADVLTELNELNRSLQEGKLVFWLHVNSCLHLKKNSCCGLSVGYKKRKLGKFTFS